MLYNGLYAGRLSYVRAPWEHAQKDFAFVLRYELALHDRALPSELLMRDTDCFHRVALSSGPRTSLEHKQCKILCVGLCVLPGHPGFAVIAHS